MIIFASLLSSWQRRFLQLLLEEGGALWEEVPRDSHGKTPLHLAAEFGNAETLAALLTQRAAGERGCGDGGVPCDLRGSDRISGKEDDEIEMPSPAPLPLHIERTIDVLDAEAFTPLQLAARYRQKHSVVAPTTIR
jgi:ankyrin repeat protein